MLDEPRSPIILNLTASYSPDAFGSEASGGGSDGTIARGGQTAGLSFALGRVTKSFTVARCDGGQHARWPAGDRTPLANATSTQSDACWSYNLGLATQSSLRRALVARRRASRSRLAGRNVSNIETGNPHVYAPSSTHTFNIALNYHILPNQLVGSTATYTYNGYTDATNTFAKAASDTAVENRMGNVVGVRQIYVFN